MKRLLRWLAILFSAMALFRFVPGLAALWRDHAALPLLQSLHRLTAALPFPLLEPLAMAAACALFHRRTRRFALVAIAAMYGLLWYPAYFAAPVPQYAPAADAEALCVQLADALNAAPLNFDSPCDDAGTVAGLPWARVKPARYPEWMRAMGIAGLFAPWTGEVLVDPDAPPETLPFTCAHELQHLKGIADEGAANLAAFRACVDHGGAYADSARLWALRYAMERLSDAARARIIHRASARLRPLLSSAAPRDVSPLARLLGIDRQTRDYDALIDGLMAGEVDF